MTKISQTKLVEASNAKEYQEQLKIAIDELQSSNLEVDIQHSMSRAQKGVGYMYSAIVIGRLV
ncbi:hypothetical protein ACYSNR_13770 [Enterococcus sp. LJL128]